MIESLQGQFRIWAYARRNTIRFLEQLSESDLKNHLPRKTFATIFEQIAEMAWVQKCFVDGIETGEMDSTDWTVPAFEGRDGLLEQMKLFDEKMERVLAGCDGTEVVTWSGRGRNVHEAVSLMLMHETMHLGQIIAFCHSLGIGIPEDVTKAMFLTG